MNKIQQDMVDEIIKDITELINLSYDTGWNAGAVEHGHMMPAWEQQDVIRNRIRKHYEIVNKLKFMKEIF